MPACLRWPRAVAALFSIEWEREGVAELVGSVVNELIDEGTLRVSGLHVYLGDSGSRLAVLPRSYGWAARSEPTALGECMLHRVVASKTCLPATVGQQLAWMRESGFTDVTCAYRNLIFAVISGTKPINSGSTTS
jgi:hypothetical protein